MTYSKAVKLNITYYVYRITFSDGEGELVIFHDVTRKLANPLSYFTRCIKFDTPDGYKISGVKLEKIKKICYTMNREDFISLATKKEL